MQKGGWHKPIDSKSASLQNVPEWGDYRKMMRQNSGVDWRDLTRTNQKKRDWMLKRWQEGYRCDPCQKWGKSSKERLVRSRAVSERVASLSTVYICRFDNATKHSDIPIYYFFVSESSGRPSDLEHGQSPTPLADLDDDRLYCSHLSSPTHSPKKLKIEAKFQWGASDMKTSDSRRRVARNKTFNGQWQWWVPLEDSSCNPSLPSFLITFSPYSSRLCASPPTWQRLCVLIFIHTYFYDNESAFSFAYLKYVSWGMCTIIGCIWQTLVFPSIWN